MKHSPKSVFNFSLDRAKHLLVLYDILHNSRQRDGRKDWLSSFKKFMHWPLNETITRVDGKDKKSLLILRGSLGLSSANFAHTYVSELLRASIVSSVSAMDRYFHDLILYQSWALLSKPEREIPSQMKSLPIPAYAVKKSLEKLRSNPKARPGNQLKQEIQQVLHKKYTFQNPGELEAASKILGLKDFWRVTGQRMGLSAEALQAKLRSISHRRNQIVHEADVVLKTKGKEITLRDITRNEADDIIKFIEKFIKEVDEFACQT
jgi:hypothetical protein